MDNDEFLKVLEREGMALADTAQTRGLDSIVPTCPAWSMRDLVTHVGHVHRWANTHVAEARPDRAPFGEAAGVVAPSDEHLVDWYRDGHAQLLITLRSADPTLTCWTFLPARSPLTFWVRRQAHETAIHRADSEAGVGPITRFDAKFASDGIDELVMSFAPTPRAKVTAEHRRVLAIRTTDTGDEWVIGLGPGGIDSQRGPGRHDAALTGAAADLYLFLWNRLALADGDIQVSGAADVVALWGSSLHV